jgi:hypothetical protein
MAHVNDAADREDLEQALTDLRHAEDALRRVVARQNLPARHYAGQAEAHCDVACRAIRKALAEAIF